MPTRRGLRVRRRRWEWTLKVFDAVVFAAYLPACVVLGPAVIGYLWLQQWRPVRVGREITHWRRPDLRYDYVVVDVSRVKREGRVGVRMREWWVRGAQGAPQFGEEVVFISVRKFWVGEVWKAGWRR
jgi:hypothetical protein